MNDQPSEQARELARRIYDVTLDQYDAEVVARLIDAALTETRCAERDEIVQALRGAWEPDLPPDATVPQRATRMVVLRTADDIEDVTITLRKDAR